MSVTLSPPPGVIDAEPLDPPATAPPARAGRAARLWRGHEEDPRWARPSMFGMLFATALLYLWNLGASGNANSFYAAAVQAGTQSWKAFLFGSIDNSNFITVDKPPASLWVMELSGRIFGFDSWSMLVPQALEGVAAVAILYAAVRRWSGPAAGLFAGSALALTPAATLIFRFNNPDALLVLLLVAAAFGVVRAIDDGRTRWLVMAGALIGLGFITKMGQALLIVPVFALIYLVVSPNPLRRRITQLLVAGAAMIAGAGWWVAIAELWPASSRPYFGGSTDNNILQLAFGYNGLGRLFGGSGNGGSGGGGGGGGGGNSGFGGATGLTRLFRSEMGLEISWLLPAALLAIPAGLWLTRRAARTDHARAGLLIWGGWLVATGLVFSYMQGTIHPYYTVALAPAIAGVLGVTGKILWDNRYDVVARSFTAVLIVVTAAWDWTLLERTSSWHPELRWGLVLVAAAALASLAAARIGWRRGVLVASLGAIIVGTAGPAAYAVSTASHPHTGSIPSVGPGSVSGGMGGMGGMGGGGMRGGGMGGWARPTGGFGFGTPPTGIRPQGGTPPTGAAPTGTGGGAGVGGAGGGEATTSTALTAALKAATTRWAAATVGSQSAASLELSSGSAVMAIGGFSGTDATPTLAAFEKLVAAGDIKYFVAAGGGMGGGGMGGGGMGGGGTASAITSWVEAHYTATTVGGTTVYDLTATAR